MGAVKLILKESVHNLGEAGDVVSVKPGFARNFLIPRGKAIIASEARVNELEHQQRVVAELVARELKNLQAARSKLAQLPLEVQAQAGESGKLFGSVTAAQIAELLAEKGYEIDRRKIQLAEPIKELGEHKVAIKLHRDVVADVKLTVSASDATPPAPEVDETRDFDDLEAERNRLTEGDED